MAASTIASSSATLAVSSAAAQQLQQQRPVGASAFGGLSLRVSSVQPAHGRARRARVVMSAEPSESKRPQNFVTPTSLALLAAAVLPEIAEAASPGVSPSLKNLLLSVLAGGTVLTVIGVGVAGISSFDPVNRK